MKFRLGIVAVFALLLAIVPCIGCSDSSAVEEPTDEVEGPIAPKVDEEPEVSTDAESSSVPDTSIEEEGLAEQESPSGTEEAAEAENPDATEPSSEPESETDSGPEVVPATELEQAYLESVSEYVSAIGDSVNVAGALFSEPRYDDEEWETLILAYLSQIEGSPDAFEEVAPPPSLEDASDAALSMLEHCSTFAELMGEAVEDEETEFPEESFEALRKADEFYKEWVGAMAAFLELHPIVAQ